jgi:hypothetical protein
VREWKHWQGLRHWAALQLLFTDAGRTGRIRWTLDAHLEALGYGDRSRRDPRVRATVAAEVEADRRQQGVGEAEAVPQDDAYKDARQPVYDGEHGGVVDVRGLGGVVLKAEPHCARSDR